MEHAIHKGMESHRAYWRQVLSLVRVLVPALVFATVIALFLGGCGSASPTPVATPPPPAVGPLSATDVDNIVKAAAAAADVDTMVIAVVDRGGKVLAVFHKPSAPAMDIGNFNMPVDANDLAVALARTAAYFSNDAAPLSSRTVRFISGIHFPPGVANAPTADLYGIENTNRGCTLSSSFLPGQAIEPSLSLSGGAGTGLGIITGKSQIDDSDPNAVNPGGVPIFRSGVVVGGIGVAGVSHDVAEFAAYTGATSNGFGPSPAPPGVVFIGGIALPFVNQTSLPAGVNAGTANGSYYLSYSPVASTGQPPEGDLVGPSAGPLGGLTAADVKQILDNAEATANTTRAAIRLPLGSRTRMAIAVADLDGTIIGLRRMVDSTVFSVDVAATKARNMVYFNSQTRTPSDLNQVPLGTAVTNRTISFGSQPLFPPGINGSADGPFYNLYLQDVQYPCTEGFQGGGANDNKSGIVFFPGSAGLYRNGVLVGGLGVSGDGVDQDDFVTSGGTAGFEAPTQIRADQIFVDSVRLPYFKFPRDPTN